VLKSIKILSDLSRIDKIVFDGVICDDDHNETGDFCKLLRTLSEVELSNFLSSFPKEIDISDYKNRVKEAGNVSKEELGILDQKFVEIALKAQQKRIEMEKNTIRVKELSMQYREALKADFKHFDKAVTDQTAGIEVPPAQKAVSSDAEVYNLPEIDRAIFAETDVYACLNNRRSRRSYKDEALSLAELSFLLWATQGVKRKSSDNKFSTRTVPSGGSRHPFETYLAVHNVTGLKPGIYRYQPFDNQIVFLFSVDDLRNKAGKAALGQSFVGNCAVTFIWSVIPYRMEWRYTLDSRKIILQDSGHLCQNLYIACEAISCGTCAIGAYDQKLFDELLRLDGTDEFVVYVAPVGKVDKPAPVIKSTLNDLKKFCGFYWCEEKMLKREILLKSGNLYYCRDEDSESKLEYVGVNKFRLDEAEAILTFAPDGKNWKMSLELDGETALVFTAAED
jgi:SagB-type dehydrogenase family enzyme